MFTPIRRLALSLVMLVGLAVSITAFSPATHADYLGSPPTISVDGGASTMHYTYTYVTGSHFTPGGRVEIWIVRYGGASVGYAQTTASQSSCSGTQLYCFVGGTIATKVYWWGGQCWEPVWVIAKDDATGTWSNEPFIGLVNCWLF